MTELQRHKIAHVQVLPLPSSSVNTTTSNTNNTNSYRAFDDTTSGDAKALNSPSRPEEHRRSEAGIERVSAECGAHVTGATSGATTTERKKTERRRWRRRLLSNETVVENSTRSIPKLTLPPQKASITPGSLQVIPRVQKSRCRLPTDSNGCPKRNDSDPRLCGNM